jgi:hypothetical protein
MILKKILNQNNQTIQEGQKNFRGNKLSKILFKSTIFQNSRGAATPLAPFVSTPVEEQ